MEKFCRPSLLPLSQAVTGTVAAAAVWDYPLMPFRNGNYAAPYK
jgi:hypothetical protein